jgi:hypothetical protein
MTAALRRLTAITALLDTAQRDAARLALPLHPDGLPAAAALALLHALECAQVQALTFRRLLTTPRPGHGQQEDKEGTTPCLPAPPALS